MQIYRNTYPHTYVHTAHTETHLHSTYTHTSHLHILLANSPSAPQVERQTSSSLPARWHGLSCTVLLNPGLPGTGLGVLSLIVVIECFCILCKLWWLTLLTGLPDLVYPSRKTAWFFQSPMKSHPPNGLRLFNQPCSLSSLVSEWESVNWPLQYK